MSDLGNKDVMAANLRRLLTYNDKLQKQVCSDLNIKETTFSDWINAKNYPRIDKIEMLANYFGVKKSDLIERHTANTSSNAIRVPVFASIPTDMSLSAAEGTLGYEEMPEHMAAIGTFFGLKIKDQSMEPQIQIDDVVIIQQVSDIDSGSIAIAMVNEETTCRKVVKQTSGISLVPINPAFNPMFFSNEEVEAKSVQIIGKVIELRRKF